MKQPRCVGCGHAMPVPSEDGACSFMCKRWAEARAEELRQEAREYLAQRRAKPAEGGSEGEG